MDTYTQNKLCSRCKHFKPIGDFHNRNSPGLTTNTLKTCVRCRSLSKLNTSRASKKRSLQDDETATPPAKKLREITTTSSPLSNFHRAGDRSPGRTAKQARDREARGRRRGHTPDQQVEASQPTDMSTEPVPGIQP